MYYKKFIITLLYINLNNIIRTILLFNSLLKPNWDFGSDPLKPFVFMFHRKPSFHIKVKLQTWLFFLRHTLLIAYSVYIHFWPMFYNLWSSPLTTFCLTSYGTLYPKALPGTGLPRLPPVKSESNIIFCSTMHNILMKPDQCSLKETHLEWPGCIVEHLRPN